MWVSICISAEPSKYYVIIAVSERAPCRQNRLFFHNLLWPMHSVFQRHLVASFNVCSLSLTISPACPLFPYWKCVYILNYVVRECEIWSILPLSIFGRTHEMCLIFVVFCFSCVCCACYWWWCWCSVCSVFYRVSHTRIWLWPHKNSLAMEETFACHQIAVEHKYT